MGEERTEKAHQAEKLGMMYLENKGYFGVVVTWLMEPWRVWGENYKKRKMP